jgi:lysine 6-dehydrogenase
MKVMVFGGSGKMGRAVAWDLIKQDDVEVVGLVGRRQETLAEVRELIGSAKIAIHALNIEERDSLLRLMEAYDVGVSTLPDRRTSYALVDAAIYGGLDFVDMLEEFHRRPDPYETEGLQIREGMGISEYGEWLHEQAIKNGVTFMDGIGFAPGISNITVGEGIRKLDRAEKAVARVGGIPSKEASQRHPLRYMITWAFEHVLREYIIKVGVIKGGEIVEVDAMSDRESFLFTKFGKNETLECAITPGMPSFLFTRPHLQEFAEKTIRWPGHWDSIITLKECGMLDLDPIENDGVEISPREFLLQIIEPKLRPQEGDTDVCVMWNSVVGEKDGRRHQVDYYLWDEADTEHGISSMARVTGFSASIGAQMIGRGLITEKGIVPPEECIYGDRYELFVDELRKRDIEILEEMKELD